MTGNTNKEITQQREHDAWELRLRCYSQVEIAQELGISQAAVSQILKRVGTRLAEQFSENAQQMLAEQTGQLLRVAREALAAWEASKYEAHGRRSEPTPAVPDTGEQNINIPSPCEGEGAGELGSASPPSLPGKGAGGLGNEGAGELGSASPPSLPGKGAGGLGTAAKPAYLRIALKALADLRALHGLNKPYQPEVEPYNDNVKMLIGVDLDRMKYKDGTPVPRKEVDRLMALQEQ